MKADNHKKKPGAPAMAMEIIKEGRMIPCLMPDANHSEVGFADVPGMPGMRRVFFHRRGVIVNNNVIVGTN